jgi:hypothetical protein
MYMMRLRLNQGAGRLAAVANCLGRSGVNINRLQTHRAGNAVVLELLLDLDCGKSLEAVLTDCRSLDGVLVEQVDRYPSGGSLHHDLEVIDRMTCAEAPARLLTTAAPLLCEAQWAALVDCGRRLVEFRTALAPDLTEADLSKLGDLQTTHAIELDQTPCSTTSRLSLALVALPPSEALLIGRSGGSEFSAAELARLDYLAGFAASRPSSVHRCPLGQDSALPRADVGSP